MRFKMPITDDWRVWHILKEDGEPYCGHELSDERYRETEDQPRSEYMVCWVCRRSWERQNDNVPFEIL